MLSFNNSDVTVQISDKTDAKPIVNTYLNSVFPFSVAHPATMDAGHGSMKSIPRLQNGKDRNISSPSKKNSFIRTQVAAAGVTKFSECRNAIRGIYFIDLEKEIPAYNSAITGLNIKEISASPD